MSLLRKDGQPRRTHRDKSHCIKGHAFTPENTIERFVKKHGWRFRECKICRTEWNKTARAEPAVVAEAIETIKQGSTIAKVTRYAPGGGKRPLIRHNQLVTALRADPQLDAAIRQISSRNAATARMRSVLRPSQSPMPRVSNLRPTTLSGVVAGRPDSIFAAVDAAVSRALPRHVRDDVIGELVLSILDGRLLIAQIGNEARKLASRQFGETKFGPISLDSPAFRDGTTPLVETISQGLWQ